MSPTVPQPPYLLFITYEASYVHTNATQLHLLPEALLFTSVYSQLPVPYDLASNGTAIIIVCELSGPCAVPDYQSLLTLRVLHLCI